MRDTHVCPKCRNNHILLIAAVPDDAAGADPVALKVAFAKAKEFLSSTTRKGVGHLEAAVCRRCGFTEFYTRDPGNIPVDDQYVREAVGPEPTGGDRCFVVVGRLDRPSTSLAPSGVKTCCRWARYSFSTAACSHSIRSSASFTKEVASSR